MDYYGKANRAKIEITKTNLKEQIELAVLNSRINENLDIRINLNTLEKGINEIQEVTGIEKQGADGNLPWTVMAGGFEFQIKEDGTVEIINGISLSKTKVKIVEGTSETITATVSKGIDGNIIWKSSDLDVITVNNGTIIAVSSGGTATVTVSIESNGVTYEAKCEVNVVSKVTDIKAENLTIIEGKTKPIVVTTIPANNVEELIYEPTDTNMVTVDANGNVTAKKLSEGQTTVETSVIIQGKTSKVTGICKITIQAAKKLAIGEFVEYDVSYTDVYSNYKYSTINGWRLLEFDDNKDGTYSNVKLISTGIPVMFYYEYGDLTNNTWWITDDTGINKFKDILGGRSYNFYTGSDAYHSLWISAGMYENFEKILFSYPKEPNRLQINNKGSYLSIVNGSKICDGSNITSGSGNELFKTEKASNIRAITLPEINKSIGRTDIDSVTEISKTQDAKGMYMLSQLQNMEGMHSYVYNDSSYWFSVASPYPNNAKNYCISQRRIL